MIKLWNLISHLIRRRSRSFASILSRSDLAKALHKDGNKPSTSSFLFMGSLVPNSHLPDTFKGFSDSLGYFDWEHLASDRMHEACRADVTVSGDVRSCAESEIDVANRVKQDMTWLNFRNKIKDVTSGGENILEALHNLWKMTTFGEEGCAELAKANHDLAQAYAAVLDFEGALPYCLKALEIHKKHLGPNSVEVAHDRKLLGIVYSGLEEHEKSLLQNVLAQGIFKDWNLNSDLLLAEIQAANMMIALGIHDEAVGTLKNVIQQTTHKEDSETRVFVLITMAKALCYQEKLADCKSCLEISLGILSKNERIIPVEVVAEAYTEISMQYVTMNEFKAAISLLKRALALLEKHRPQEQHAQGCVSARIGWLLLFTGKLQSAIFYLEGAAERLHVGIGYVYNNLGVAYLKVDRPKLARRMFYMAKDNITSDPDRIKAWQNLSKAEAEMGEHIRAVNHQKRVIVASEESLGASLEARQLLEQLEKRERGASANANVLPMKALLLPLTLATLRIPFPDMAFVDSRIV